MQFFRLTALLACLSAPAASLLAQGHAPHAGCSMSAEDGAIVKDRMLRNRHDAQIQAALQNRSSALPTYIPLGITTVANTSGVGYASIEQIHAMVCDLNRDYADQNVFFYIKDSIRYRQNNNVYNDAWAFNSSIYMAQNKVPNALNIYISPTVNNAVASFYTPAGDYVFLITSEVNGTSNTATHEVGHFFTLPHTFYGWEGVAYHDDYQGVNAPNTMGGENVEKVARTGGNANCAIAADGFCDTEADYISDRWNCPYVGVSGVLAKDPLGVDINPDETNYMSYFFDGCLNRFSTQQKAAMLADMQSRGWSNLAAPTPIDTLSGFDVVLNAPINDFIVLANGTNTVTLQWTALTGANQYIVRLERTLQGQPIADIFTVRTTTNSYTFNTSALPAPPANGNAHDYRWSVKPFNNHYTCAGFSDYGTFKASINGQPVGLDESAQAAAASSLSLRVQPNPIQGGSVQIQLNSQMAQSSALRIYSADGKLLINSTRQHLEAGENSFSIDAAGLSAGLYIVVATDEKGGQAYTRFTVLP